MIAAAIRAARKEWWTLGLPDAADARVCLPADCILGRGDESTY